MLSVLGEYNMNTTAIIALSIVGSLFVILLLAAAGILIYLLLITRRATLDNVNTLRLLQESVRSTLEANRVHFDAKLSTLNGQELAEAAKIISQSATRIERAAIAFGQLAAELLSGEGVEEIHSTAIERARRSGLGPESFAPAGPGERYTSASRTATGDAEAILDESRDNSFDSGIAGEG